MVTTTLSTAEQTRIREANAVGLLTYEQASELMSVHVNSVKAWVKRGNVPTVPIDNKPYVPVQVVLRRFQRALENEDTREATVQLLKGKAERYGFVYDVENNVLVSTFVPERVER